MERARTSVLALALEWQAMIRQPGIANRAGLAAVGVRRAWITQGMAVLAAPQPLLQAMRSAVPNGRMVTDGVWRKVSSTPVEEAIRALEAT